MIGLAIALLLASASSDSRISVFRPMRAARPTNEIVALQRGDVIVVRWTDASGELGWQPEGLIHAKLDARALDSQTVSVGIFITVSNGFLVIAQDRGCANDSWNAVGYIPIGLIRSVHRTGRIILNPKNRGERQ